MIDQGVALIVFREVIEIAMILGVVLAATRGLAGRKKWISIGFASGIGGSLLVAAFASSISSLASGMGQEIFNAIILLAAALVIGWTAIWMHTHAREMSAHLKQIGNDVTNGKLPGYSLSLVIGLALLREGSEIVLFLYGQIIQDKNLMTIMFGAIAGLSLGVITGLTLYVGLVKMSTRYMLKVTGWLLVFLVAGLSAQAAGFLLAAGYFSDYSAVVWNSSWLLPDNNTLGKALHTLIGYTARPTQVEMAFYCSTFLVMVFLMYLTSRKLPLPATAKTMAAIAVACLLFSLSQNAQALDTHIYSPRVEKGELELEYATKRTFDNDSRKNNEQKHMLGIGYGFTDYLFVEAYLAELKREPGGFTDYVGNEIEAIVQFWPTGKYWLDAGLLAAYELNAKKHGADEVEFKLLLQKDTGRFTTLVNLGVEREVGNNAVAGNELSTAINTRYRYSPYFEPGIELQSEYGTHDEHKDFDEQEHYLGAVVYGRLLPQVKYEAGIFAGISDAAANSAIRFKLEYELPY
jgi:high-affinity iron transporter